MSTWSLSQLLADLHDDIQNRLATAGQRFRHAGTKDDASERVRLSRCKTTYLCMTGWECSGGGLHEASVKNEVWRPLGLCVAKCRFVPKISNSPHRG